MNLTFSLSSSDVFGVIGDAAPGGWDSTNDELIPDPCTDGVYLAQNVSMTAGVFKIRQNNDWTLNYGLGDGELEPSKKVVLEMIFPLLKQVHIT